MPLRRVLFGSSATALGFTSTPASTYRESKVCLSCLFEARASSNGSLSSPDFIKPLILRRLASGGISSCTSVCRSSQGASCCSRKLGTPERADGEHVTGLGLSISQHQETCQCWLRRHFFPFSEPKNSLVSAAANSQVEKCCRGFNDLFNPAKLGPSLRNCLMLKQDARAAERSARTC